MQDADRLKREEANRKKVEDERAALVNQFEKARDEMKGVLARNRELVSCFSNCRYGIFRSSRYINYLFLPVENFRLKL